jgi:hypothetical protein
MPRLGAADRDPVPALPSRRIGPPAARSRRRRRAPWRPFAAAAASVAAMALMIQLPAAGASPASSAGKLTTAERAIAAAINIRRADLPAGFSVEPNSGVSYGGDPATRFKSCYGPGATEPGRNSPNVSSPSFSKNAADGESVAVGSGVAFPSRDQLARDTGYAGNPRFPQCVAEAFAALTLKAEGVKITGSRPRGVELPNQIRATADVQTLLGMRASFTWTVRGVSLPVYLDLYLVRVGGEEIDLYTFATVQPVLISSEAHLLSLMVARALAQPH